MILVKKQDLVNSYDYKELAKREKKERETWKWIILLGCFLFQMIPYCVAVNLTNNFGSNDWAAWFAGDSTFIHLSHTMGALGAAIAAPGLAKLLGKPISMRFIYILGIVVAMIGFMGMGSAAMYADATGEIPSKGVAIVLVWIPIMITQIGTMIYSGLGVNNLISKWWEPEKRGFALGIAFAGGSVGNIWIQQILALLSKQFSNGEYVDPHAHQWATYIILGGMGLVAGIIICLFACRKPLPPIDILNAEKGKEQNLVATKKALEVTPLVAMKYPPYWVLCIGFAILQMGTVHTIASGEVVRATIGFDPETGLFNTNKVVEAMGTFGTLFGIGCLFGNVLGGILNDKLGPAKSISLAGAIQLGAILCLTFIVKSETLLYVYAILSGLSVYLYTSTPAFVSGRLFGAGQSNEHMAILGLFIAGAFAIVNSISGPMIGEISPENLGEIAGVKTAGKVLNIEIFSLVCMFVGTVIVVTACAIITKKGIKGMLEYSPTKYSKIVFFKHNTAINFASLKIELTKKDFRNSEKRKAKISEKQNADPYFNSFNKYEEAVKSAFKSEKLNEKEIKLLSIIYFNGIMTSSELNDLYKLENVEKEAKALITKKLIETVQFGNQPVCYKMSEKAISSLSSSTATFTSEFSKIENEKTNINNILNKLDDSLKSKLEKINVKLEAAKAAPIDEEKDRAIEAKAEAKINVINSIKEVKLNNAAIKNQWSQYKVDYSIAEKLARLESEKHKLEEAKKAKIEAIQKKMFIAQYISNYNKFKQVEGHNLLVDYFNDVWGTYDDLIDERISNDFERKTGVVKASIERKQAKLAKLISNEEKIQKQLSK